MKFGHTTLSDDFLPTPLELISINKRDKGDERSRPKSLHVGLSSFSHPEWIGSIYPKSTLRKGMLSAYASMFSAIEFNATRYKFPSPAQVKNWTNQTQNGFKFYPKVPQSISHSKNYLSLKTSDQLEDFMELTKGFSANFGYCFLCFPNHVGVQRLGEILEWVDTMEMDFPLAFELRHPSWFEGSSSALYTLAQALSAKNLSLIITDTPGRQDVRHNLITSKNVMVRFVASGNTKVDQRRMHLWREAFVSHVAISSLACFVHAPTEDKRHLLSLMAYLNDNPYAI